MKKTQTFKLDPELIEELKKLSVKAKRPFNNYVELALKEHIERPKCTK